MTLIGREAATTLANTLMERERELAEARAWINDLQSGMYINCVYCGHRYGPNDETPASMADVLKEHVERCSKHPMSALRTQLALAEGRLQWLDENLDPTVTYWTETGGTGNLEWEPDKLGEAIDDIVAGNDPNARED